MTSTIKVDNIQNQCGANIINESSNTITIGASGDTVSLASGASQSGFGRTGTVDWDTTKKTASFTATNGDALVNFSAGTKNVFCTLPASRTMSPGMVANTFVVNQSSTLSEDQTLDSGVVAGPVTVTGTQTVTGTLVII